MLQRLRESTGEFGVLERESELRTWLGLGLLIAAVGAYLPSFNAWFFLDDFRILLENPALQNVFDPVAVWRFSEPRFFASLTLAANYSLHGEQVFGYHLVNFLIHFGSGAALWLLLHALLRAPALAPAPPWLRWVPWIAAAIFLLHPLQTQAVTYIVQRYTSLMAMCYLASLAAWAWARLGNRRWAYALSIMFALLALLSKQPAATLPLAVLLLELVFFRRLATRTWILMIAAGALAAVVTGWLLTLPALDIVGLTRETDQISRIDYLATQMEVLWRYLGLFFLIGSQRLEYDLTIVQGFSSITPIALAIGHMALIALALSLWRRWPLVSFGTIFYYLVHSIESGFLPIIDVAFEHRTYLPNAGLAIAVAVGLAWLIASLQAYRVGTAITLGLMLLLAGNTYARNALWADQIEFLRHETRLSPGSQRAWTSLGKELMRRQQFEQALEALQRAQQIGLNRDNGRLRPPTLLNMVFALHYTGKHAQALALADSIEADQLNRTERAFLLEARGRARLALGDATGAREDLMAAAQSNPSIAVITYLAAAELALGNRTRARRLADRVLELDPGNTLAREIQQRAR